MSDVLFVYGTLKIGQSRGGLFSEMISGGFEIKQATIKGKLYDLGPYPAVVEGEDTVHGEAVVLKDGLIDKMIPVLDRIEGYYGEGSSHNLYNRVTTTAEVDGEQVDVTTYMFSKPSVLDTYAEYVPEGVWPAIVSEELY
jgi:gamma-glutamylcyclotransferase (GGCT)/AIG2-like uncharacterized protein YtfP